MPGTDEAGAGEPGLTDEEVSALARVFPPGPSANALLRRVGYPAERMPSELGVTREEFWSSVAETVASGLIENGRARLLAAACRSYPYNRVFCRAVEESGRIRRVLVIGASPHGYGRVRADRELRAIQQAAARTGLTVECCPAADVADLRRVLDLRPDVLHLVCHGEDENLVFEDTFGEAHQVPANQVARMLRAYREHAGLRLRGLVLASCDSEAVAALFTGSAAVVVAHRGPLDDTAAVSYAGDLYGLLDRVTGLDDAARIAAAQTAAALGGEYGEALRANLVVLGRAGGG
jgi:hypothetical protein